MSVEREIDPMVDREVITGGHLPLEEARFLATELERTPWRGKLDVLSYARVLRKDRFGEPIELRESWAPERLFNPDALENCDDERLFEFIGERRGTYAVPWRSSERIFVRAGSQDERELLRLPSGNAQVISIGRTYRNFEGSMLLSQLLVAPPGSWVAYERSLNWEHVLRSPGPWRAKAGAGR